MSSLSPNNPGGADHPSLPINSCHFHLLWWMFFILWPALLFLFTSDLQCLHMDFCSAMTLMTSRLWQRYRQRHEPIKQQCYRDSSTFSSQIKSPCSFQQLRYVLTVSLSAAEQGWAIQSSKGHDPALFSDLPGRQQRLLG